MSLSRNDVALCLALRMFFKMHAKMHLFRQYFLTSDMNLLFNVQFSYNQSISQTDRYLIHSNDSLKMLANLSFYRETSVAIVIQVNTF